MFAAVTARQKARPFQNAAIARRFQQAVQTLTCRPQGHKGRPAVRTWQADSGEHKKATDFAP